MVELLSPAGDWPMLTAAIKAKADAVYFGVKELNMRASAANFEISELKKVVQCCHKNKVRAYLALNTIVYENEIEKVNKIIAEAKKAGIDAVIAWDISVIQTAKKNKIPIHLSTQANVSNFESAKFFYKLGASRIVFARELSLAQIKDIIAKIKKQKLKLEAEVFIHGAMCVSISGRCFLSQSIFKKSANRGDCLHPCRRPYRIINEDTGHDFRLGNNFILSPKDLCALPFLKDLFDAGIHSFKIEGRNKSAEYVQVATECYREAINLIKKKNEIPQETTARLIKKLKTVYNRGFSSGFYLGLPTSDDLTDSEGSKSTQTKHYAGYIKNFFNKILVAEIKIDNNPVKIGDEIRITGNKTGTFTQIITSMEYNHKKIKKAERGASIAIKMSQTARINDKVFVVRSNEA